MLGKEINQQKKIEKDELKKVRVPSLKENIISRRNDMETIQSIRIICSHCEAVLNTEEKVGIIDKLERGVNCKVMCKSCVKDFNKRYFEKNSEKLKAKRTLLRDMVRQDKANYQCDCESGCNVRKTLIYHRKRKAIVNIATITLNDYIENCKIVCAKKVSYHVIEPVKSKEIKADDFGMFIDKIANLDCNHLFAKLNFFQNLTSDWLIEYSDKGITNFGIYLLENTDSIYKNNLELLLVANSNQVIYSTNSFGSIYKNGEPSIDNKQFEIKYCLDKFFTEVNYDNLLSYVKTCLIPAQFKGDDGEDYRLDRMELLTIDTYDKLK